MTSDNSILNDKNPNVKGFQRLSNTEVINPTFLNPRDIFLKTKDISSLVNTFSISQLKHAQSLSMQYLRHITDIKAKNQELEFIRAIDRAVETKRATRK